MKENLNKYIVDSITPNEVISPKKIDDIIEIIQTSNQKNDKIIVWGSGTKISIGNIPEKLDIILKTERMNQVVEYIPENLTVTTNSGIKLKELQSELNKRGQFLPIDPFNSENATIGGIIGIPLLAIKHFFLRGGEQKKETIAYLKKQLECQKRTHKRIEQLFNRRDFLKGLAITPIGLKRNYKN